MRLRRSRKQAAQEGRPVQSEASRRFQRAAKALVDDEDMLWPDAYGLAAARDPEGHRDFKQYHRELQRLYKRRPQESLFSLLKQIAPPTPLLQIEFDEWGVASRNDATDGGATRHFRRGGRVRDNHKTRREELGLAGEPIEFKPRGTSPREIAGAVGIAIFRHEEYGHKSVPIVCEDEPGDRMRRRAGRHGVRIMSVTTYKRMRGLK